MPSWGGIREGAGRKRDPYRTTAIATKIIEKMRATGRPGPLDFLVDIAVDEDQPVALRIDCAKAACPYLYPKLQSVQVQQDESNRLVVVLQSFSRDGTNTAMIETKPLVPMPVIKAVTSESDDEE